MEPLRIRPLEAEDVAQVSAVLGLSRLDQADGVYLVAWEGRSPVGHAHLALTDPPELQDVEVRPERRRGGVASALAAGAEDLAAEHGADRVRLLVSADDVAVRRLYASLGYVDTGIAPLRVRGTVMLRTGPLEVDDTLLTWEKRLPPRPRPDHESGLAR